MRHEDLLGIPCSISRPLAVLGDRWTLVLIKQAFAGTRRFEDFQSILRIPRGRLADRLHRLVAEGILRHEPYRNGRTRHEYRLTEKGHELYPVLIALRDWGDRHMAPDGPPIFYRHENCGGEAHVHVTCELCNQELTARDVVPEPGPGLMASNPSAEHAV